MNDLVAAFHEYFEIISADSPDLMEEVFRLRYQVLCIEERLPGFGLSNYLDGLESDSYDRHAAHSLLRHRPSGNYVGALRLILPDPENPEKLFPLERYAQINPEIIDVAKLPRQHLAEISRVIIVTKFPHRKAGDRRRHYQELDSDRRNPKPRRRFPHPIVGLMVGLIRMSAQYDITHWYAVMDPSLNRLITPYGLGFEPIGPLTEYHGQRLPYYIDLNKALNRLYIHHRMVWELLTDYGRVWPPALEKRAQPRHCGTT